MGPQSVGATFREGHRCGARSKVLYILQEPANGIWLPARRGMWFIHLGVSTQAGWCQNFWWAHKNFDTTSSNKHDTQWRAQKWSSPFLASRQNFEAASCVWKPRINLPYLQCRHKVCGLRRRLKPDVCIEHGHAAWLAHAKGDQSEWNEQEYVSILAQWSSNVEVIKVTFVLCFCCMWSQLKVTSHRTTAS